MNASKLLLSTALSALISLSSTGNVYADDTDIYLEATSTSSTDVLPKILIVFDTSGSMESNDIDVAGAYDPATTYTGSWDSTKIYWTSGSSEPTDTSTTQHFSRTNLKCESATAAFADASGGHYDNDRIMMWSGTDTEGLWGEISVLQAADSSYENYVDCREDQDDSDLYAGGSASLKYFYSFADTNTGAFPNDAYTGSTSNDATYNNFFKNFEKLYLWDGNYLNAQESGTAGTRTLTRMQVAQEAMNEIITTTNNVEMGLMVFNANNDGGEDGGSMAMAISELDSSHRTDMKSVVNSLSGYFNGSTSSDGQNYTPLSETLYEAYRYFGGLTPFSGGRTSLDNPPDGYSDPRPLSDFCAQDSSSNNCAPYSAATTRATVQGYFPTAGSSQPDTTQPDYVSPLTNSCEKGYIIFVTDGDPYNDDERDDEIDALVGSSTYSTSSVSGDTGDSSNRMDDLAGYMNNNDINSDINGDQTMVTFTVGFGSGISSDGETLLKRTAGVGGGEYLTADDIDSLSDKLQAIIFSISTTTTSFNAPSLSVNAFNKLYNRDEIYFSLFDPDLHQRWAGNIKKFKLCTQAQADDTDLSCEYGDVIDRNNAPAIDITTSHIKDSSSSYWDTVTDGGDVEVGGAGKQMYDDGYANRNIYTYLGSYGSLSSTSPATPVAIVNSSTESFYQAVEPTAGDPTLIGMSASSTTTEVEAMIEWIRGKDSYNEDGDSATNQRWVFSDPLHSRPLAVTFGAVETSTNVYDYDQPIIKLLLAGNDGVIRLIDEDSGKEQWSFIPAEVLKDSQTLANNAVGSHVYGVDSTPVIYIDDVDGDGLIEPTDGDVMYAFIAMRRGSKNEANNPVFNNIYAFDLTPTSQLTSFADASAISPKLMWVIEGGVAEYALLGQTWSRPQVDTITVKDTASTNKDVLALFFGGGNSTNAETDAITPMTGVAGNAIFIANALTGDRMWWASDPAEVDGNSDGPDLALTDMDYPIPSDLALLDINADGGIDRLYVGDLGGQLWRIDLATDMDPSSTSTSGRNGSSAGHVLADLACPRNTDKTRNCPATGIEQNWRRMHYRPDVGAVRDSTYVSAGSVDYDLVIIGTGDRSDPLDKLTSGLTETPVENLILALRDYNTGFGPPSSVPAPIVVSDLHDATDNAIESATTTVAATAKAELIAGKGWYIELDEATAPAWTALDTIGSRTWIGEKVLARPVLFDGIVYVTTFTPANEDTATETCASNEGLATVYAMNALDAKLAVDLDEDGDLDRSIKLGGGIPSELVTVIREDGTVGLVGASGGAKKVNVRDSSSFKRTYWVQE